MSPYSAFAQKYETLRTGPDNAYYVIDTKEFEGGALLRVFLSWRYRSRV